MIGIEQLRPEDLNCNIFSCYDYDGLSIQELLCQFYHKINECVAVTDATIKLADWLVNEGLAQEVAKKIEEMYEDGRLTDAINNVLQFVETYPPTSCETGVVDRRYKYGDIRRFGAVPGWNDGKKEIQDKNSLAFENAIKSAGNPWDTCSHEVFVPVGSWYFNKPITILKNNISLKGAGIEATILCPQKCKAIVTYDFPQGPHGVRRYGVNISDFCISGDKSNDGIDASGMTLECKISNVKIELTKKGIYGNGCFDFSVENVHIRQAEEEGIYIEHPVGPDFKEVSYINFEWVNATECNIKKQGPCWYLAGNNFFLNNCKAVGYHGVEFAGQNYNSVVKNFYFDGKRYKGGEPGTPEVFHDCTIIQVADYNVRNIDLENIYGWNFRIAVDVKDGTSVSCKNLNPNPGNWDFCAVRMGADFKGTINLDNRNYKVEDNRTYQRPYKVIYGSSAGQPFTFEVIDTELQMHRGDVEYNIEYKGQPNQRLVAVYYMPVEDLHYTARNAPFTGQKMPAMICGHTNNEGYGVVTIKCPHVNDDELRTIHGKMILVRINNNDIITPKEPY